MTTYGKVFLVGAGPGDPRLLTVQGKRYIEQADAIVYDRLLSPRLLTYARPGARLFYVGKSAENHTMRQTEIEQLLVSLAKEGLNVVRLKGGDPFVFGRGAEEALTLGAAGIEWVVVPGVTSAIGAPVYAGIPVTFRNVAPSFSVITGHLSPEGTEEIDWASHARHRGTLVILMGVRQLPKIVEMLQEHGKPSNTPVALVRWGTRTMQETVTGTLEDIVHQVTVKNFKSPAVIIVGEVVRIREQLRWFEELPLVGKRIWVAADTQDELEDICTAVEALGGEAFGITRAHLYKSIEGVFDGFFESLRALDLHSREGFSKLGICFKSAFAVETFIEEVRRARIDLRKLSNVHIVATTNSATAAMHNLGIHPDGATSDSFPKKDLAVWCESGVQIKEPLLNDAETSVRFFHVDCLRDQDHCEDWIQLTQMWCSSPVDAMWLAESSEGLLDALGDVLPMQVPQMTVGCFVNDTDRAHKIEEQLRTFNWGRK